MSDKKYIEQQLEKEHYALRRKFEYCSPILTIQKTMKMVLARIAMKRKLRYVKLLYWSLNRWRIRKKLERFIMKMGLTRDKLFKIGKARLIQREYRKHVKYLKFRDMIVQRLQTNYRM